MAESSPDHRGSASATAGAQRIENHHGPLVVRHRVEITGTATGPVTLLAGTLIVHGRIDGDVDVDGGDLFVFGSVSGRVVNNSGSIEVSGSVGDLRGPPAYTRVLPGARVGDHTIGTDPGAIDSWASALADLDSATTAHDAASDLDLDRFKQPDRPSRSDGNAAATTPAPASETFLTTGSNASTLPLETAEPRPPSELPAPSDTAPSDTAPSDTAPSDTAPSNTAPPDTTLSDLPDVMRNIVPDSPLSTPVRPLMERRRQAPIEWTLSDPTMTDRPVTLPPEDLTDESLRLRVYNARTRTWQLYIASALVLVMVLVAVAFVAFG